VVKGRETHGAAQVVGTDKEHICVTRKRRSEYSTVPESCTPGSCKPENPLTNAINFCDLLAVLKTLLGLNLHREEDLLVGIRKIVSHALLEKGRREG
jgi:hypothetical protein